MTAGKGRTRVEPGSNPVTEFKRGWSLDMIAPLDEDSEAHSGPLLGHWSDLAVEDLPPLVQTTALGEDATWVAIARRMLDRQVVEEAVTCYLADIKEELGRRYGARDAEITLARAGLAGEQVPTLEELGQRWGITRERVRQLIREITEAESLVEWRAHLHQVIGAWLALHPRTPATVKEFTETETAKGRVMALGFATAGLSPTPIVGVWTETASQARAVAALTSRLDDLVPSASSLAELVSEAGAALPGINKVLDLEATLELLAERLDFGPGTNGRLVFGYEALSRRVAGKVVTYLQRRAAPITPPDLARVITQGTPPFEGLHRPLIEREWLVHCALRNPDSLEVLPDGQIALAPGLSHLRPTGVIGILHSIIVDHGEPMRMMDLCDQAGHFGVSRNQVGVMIHGGRAACLFMLDRGIVGLVGRDEGADPAQYEAARRGPGVRVGEEIGFDRDGRISVDIEVRRSIREQGLGLPWPFSVIRFSDHPELQVDAEKVEMALRPHGDLHLPQLEPSSTIRLRLEPTRTGHRLLIDTEATDTIETLQNQRSGAAVPTGLATAKDRPGWIDHVLERARPKIGRLEDMHRWMPAVMSPARRMKALYALVALGILRPRSQGWMVDTDRRLPRRLEGAFGRITHDPECYSILTSEERAGIGWLVRATWLVTGVGWSRVRPNDLSDAGADENDTAGQADVATSPRETALMRIVEAAYQAGDLVRHPGDLDEVGKVEATRGVVRRYLTALGYTAYGAIRDLPGTIDVDGALVAAQLATDGSASVLWMLRPIGSGIEDAGVGQARRAAADNGAATAVVTDGLRLVALNRRSDGNDKELDIDLRDVGRNPALFDRLASLSAPGTLDKMDAPTEAKTADSEQRM